MNRLGTTTNNGGAFSAPKAHLGVPMTTDASREPYYDRFPVPLLDPEASPRYPDDSQPRRRWSGLFRRPKRRRLAVVDTHLPWPLSGFRYYEFLEIQRQAPDTQFFSLHAMTAAFPVPVLPLADFPSEAAKRGITDIYGVFLNFGLGLLGLGDHPLAIDCPGVDQRLSIWSTLTQLGIRPHITVYPGGGFTNSTAPALLHLLERRCKTTFSNVPRVVSELDSCHFSSAVTATHIYTHTPRDHGADVLHICFAADDRPRKGLYTTIAALNRLDPSRFHLHLVGPHASALGAIRHGNVTPYGWLGAEELARVYQRCHVFVSPVTVDRGDDGGELGMVDGFPTQCAVDAMATGCCLVTSNPVGPSPILRSGADYLEIPERDPEALRTTLLVLAGNPDLLSRVAASGTLRVRTRMDVAGGVREKLSIMAEGSVAPVTRRAISAP